MISSASHSLLFESLLLLVLCFFYYSYAVRIQTATRGKRFLQCAFLLHQRENIYVSFTCVYHERFRLEQRLEAS